MVKTCSVAVVVIGLLLSGGMHEFTLQPAATRKYSDRCVVLHFVWCRVRSESESTFVLSIHPHNSCTAFPFANPPPVRVCFRSACMITSVVLSFMACPLLAPVLCLPFVTFPPSCTDIAAVFQCHGFNTSWMDVVSAGFIDFSCGSCCFLICYCLLLLLSLPRSAVGSSLRCSSDEHRRCLKLLRYFLSTGVYIPSFLCSLVPCPR